MAAKPTNTPRWANVGGDIVEPTSGKKDVGWVAEEKPPAQYFNWLLNLTYQWLIYLNDGVLDGDHQFLDNVDIDGNLNVDGTVQVDLAATFSASVTALSVAGTDFVSTTEGGIRHAAVEQRLAMPMYPTGTIVGGLIYTANTTGDTYFESNAGTGAARFTLPLKQGDTLTNVNAFVFDNAGGAQIEIRAWKISRSTILPPQTVGTQLGSTGTSGNSSDMQLLGIGTIAEVVTTPLEYTVELLIDANSSVRVYQILYTVSRVA